MKKRVWWFVRAYTSAGILIYATIVDKPSLAVIAATSYLALLIEFDKCLREEA